MMALTYQMVNVYKEAYRTVNHIQTLQLAHNVIQTII